MATFDDDIAALHTKLQQACLIEYTTIPAYLTGWWTIRDRRSPAAKLIREIATVEMRHLAIVSNVLTATGGQPDIHAAAEPAFPRFVPLPGWEPYPIGLLGFGDDFLRMGMYIEHPEGFFREAPVRTEATPRFREDVHLLLGMGFSSLGEFYKALMKTIAACVERHGESAVFPAGGRVERQYAYFGQDCISVAGWEDARLLLEDLVWEGEGNGGGILDSNRDLSHFFTFDQIDRRTYYKLTDKPSVPTGSALPYPTESQVVRTLPNPKVADYADYPEAVKRADAFNDFYARVVDNLHAGLRGRPDRVDVAVGQMRQLLALADDLMECEVSGPGEQRVFASPTFELPER